MQNGFFPLENNSNKTKTPQQISREAIQIPTSQQRGNAIPKPGTGAGSPVAGRSRPCASGLAAARRDGKLWLSQGAWPSLGQGGRGGTSAPEHPPLLSVCSLKLLVCSHITAKCLGSMLLYLGSEPGDKSQ